MEWLLWIHASSVSPSAAQFPETGERPVCPQVCFRGQQDYGESFLRLGNCCLLTRQAQSTLWGSGREVAPQSNIRRSGKLFIYTQNHPRSAIEMHIVVLRTDDRGGCERGGLREQAETRQSNHSLGVGRQRSIHGCARMIRRVDQGPGVVRGSVDYRRPGGASPPGDRTGSCGGCRTRGRLAAPADRLNAQGYWDFLAALQNRAVKRNADLRSRLLIVLQSHSHDATDESGACWNHYLPARLDVVGGLCNHFISDLALLCVDWLHQFRLYGDAGFQWARARDFSAFAGIFGGPRCRG